MILNNKNCRRLLCQTTVIVKKDETIQNISEKVLVLEELTAKIPSQPNVKEELMFTRVNFLNFFSFPKSLNQRKNFFKHKLSAHTKKLKAALVLSKIKNDEIKDGQTAIEEFKTNNLDLKRQLLNEALINFTRFVFFLFTNILF